MAYESDTMRKLREKYGVGEYASKTKNETTGSKSSGGNTRSREGTASERMRQLREKYGVGEHTSAQDHSNWDEEEGFINSFLRDSQKYLEDSRSVLRNMSYATATNREQYANRMATSRDLADRAETVIGYLNKNKSFLDADYYKSLVDYVRGFRSHRTSSEAAFHRAENYFSQWDSEEAYKAYEEYQKSGGWLDLNAATNEETVAKRQAKYQSNADRIAEIKASLPWIGDTFLPSVVENWFLSDEKEALKEEMETLEAENLRYDRTQGVMDKYYVPVTDEFTQNASYRDYKNASREELFDYDMSASEGSTALSNGGYYDEEGNIHNAKGDIVQYANAPVVEDKLGMFLAATDDDINEAYNALSATNGNYTDTWANLLQEGDTNGWRYLNDYEIQIYYDLLKREGQEAAYQYLSDMTTELTRRETQATTDYINNTSGWKQFGLNVASIPMNIAGGLTSFLDDSSHILQGEDINPYSRAHAFQNAAGDIRGKTAADVDRATGNAEIPWLGYSFGDAYQAVMSGADSLVGSVLGGTGYGALMGMGAASSEMKELYEQGASMDQIAAGGVLAGAAEMVFEKYSIDQFMEMGGSKTMKAVIINTLKQGGVEASEEAFTEIANAITNAIVMGSQSDWVDMDTFVKNVVNAGIGGFISGGAMGGSGATTGFVQYDNQIRKIGRDIQNAGGVDALRQFANEVAGASSDGSQKNLTDQLGRVNQRESSRNVGRLYEAVETAFTTQNQADIAKSLERRGYSSKEANAIAGALSAEARGDILTGEQIKVLREAKKDSRVQQVVNDIIGNSRSTMGQRNQALDDFRRGVAFTNAVRAYGKAQEKKWASTKENVSENSNEAYAPESGTYEDGKTYQKSTNAEVTPKKITSIQNGMVTLMTQDNRTLDAADVEFGDQGYDMVFRSITSAENMTPTAANTILQVYEKTGKNISAGVYAMGAAQAYRYGYHGMDRAALGKPSALASNLAPAQVDMIYQAGRQAAVDNTKAAQMTAKNATARKASGRVHYDGDVSVPTERQRVSLTALEKVAEATGLQFYIFESEVDASGRRIGANGWYDPRDNSIHVDRHAGMKGKDTMLFTASHELTHHIKKWSPEKFKALSDFLVTEYGKKDVSVEELVAEQIRKAKYHNRDLSYDEAFEEVIADSMETMLADGNVVEKLAKLKQQDKSLWQKVKDFISELAAKIRSVYKDLTADSVEGQYVAEMKDAIERLQDLFVEGLDDATTNYQAAMERGNLIPGEEGVVVNQNGDPVAYSTEDGSVLLSMRTYEEDGRKAFRAYLQKCVSSERLTQAEMQEMLNGIEEIYETCKKFKDKYAPFGTWSDAAVVRDTRGRPVFSVVTPNGDYKMNLDFSLVCKKRRTLDAVFNEMSRRGIIDDFELGQKSVVKINAIIRKYGLETACALCFVDAKRFRQASMADSFTNLYNELVESLVPEDQKGSIGYFNFSGYETIKKVEGGIDTWNNSRLDFSHINHVLKTYGDGTVEYKAAKYIESHPEGRKLLLRGDFMSSKGFDAVKAQNQDILKLYNSKKGTGGPKAAFGDVQYMNEIIKKARWWTPQKAYEVGGVRIQSFSDYVPRMVFDYVQMVYDLAATKLPAHAYSKESLFVKQFGLTGIKINMSLIPAVAEGGIAPGLDANGNYVWAGESFDFETAKQIQNAPGYTENCGTICVGVSYEHIRKLLSDPDIRMVIPYHKSGLNPIVAHMNKIAEFTDYTTLKTNPGGCQNTMDKNGNKVEVDFNFNDVLRKTGDPKVTVRQYLDWCAENEYTPRFAEFAWHENYYKLIEDFTLFDKDGNYVPQREVRAVFPTEESAFGSMKDLIKAGLEEDAIIEGKKDSRLASIVDEIERTIPRTEDEISEEQVEQADRDLEADVKYSFRGTNQDGIEVYETSDETKALSYKERQQRFLNIMANEYRGRTAKFIRNGHPYYATFEGKDINKNIYGDKLSDKKGWRAKINTGAEGDIFELVENAQYNGSLPEKGKKITAHRGVGYWDYFIKNVQIDGTVFDLVANVRKKVDGAFVYSIQLKENKKIKASPPLGSLLRALDGVPNASTANVTQLGQNVNKYSDRDNDSVSNRSLLANALESAAQTPEERQQLEEYRKRIETVEDAQRRLDILNRKIREASFAPGKRDTVKIAEMRKTAEDLAGTINRIDKKLLSLEASAPLKAVLEREKKNAYKRAEQRGRDALKELRATERARQTAITKQYQESRAKGIESRKKTAMRAKVKGVVQELNQYLLRGTKEKHVPIGLQKAVAEALNAVNMDTVGAEERIAKLQAEMAKAKTTEEIQKIAKKIENVQGQGDRMDDRLRSLRDAYNDFIHSDDPLVANSHDEVIAAKLEDVIKNVGDTPLRDMSLSQLEDVYDMYRMVLTTVKNVNKTFKSAKKMTISELGETVIDEVKRTGGERKYGVAALEGIRKFGWNNMKPVYAFETIGSGTFNQLFKNVRAGEDVWARDVVDAREFYLEKSRKYKYDSWDFKKNYTFESTSGMTFRLNLEQIMSLYAYSKREQAAEHLRRGGIVIDETTEVTMKNKLGIPVKFNPTEATAYNISDEVLTDIVTKLTAEQKAFVDEMQEYLSSTMGEKGNEVSLQMYGVKLFKEKNYFPLKSASQFLAKAKEQQKGEVKIKNSGFSKETVKNASNPVVLTPFMNVWADHVNDMSMYHAFVLPMEDFYRVYNFKTAVSETDAVKSVEMTIQNAYGKGATGYIEQLLKDLNGGARVDSTTGIINKGMNLFKKGAVFASASVVVQQPSAIARATALVDTKYFTGRKVDKKRHKELWAEIKKYAPVAVIKEMGYFDTNMGKSTRDFLTGKEYENIGEKMKALFTDGEFRDEVLSKAPALADELAWCAIWEAVQRESIAMYPGLMTSNKEAFKELVGARFTEVITKTQVYDSVLARSANMRSKDTGMKMATAFMGEPTTAINMVADALIQGKRGDRKYARKAIGSVIAAQILNSILVSFVYAARDDDEDETYVEKYLASMIGNTVDGMNPLTYVPFIKDAVSIVQGYEVERSDMSVISDLWNAWQKLGSDNLSVYRKVEGFGGSIAQIFGLPMKNIMRDIRAAWQVIEGFQSGYKTTRAGIGYAIHEALYGEEVSKQDKLYEALTGTDPNQITRAKAQYADEDAVMSAMKKAVKERYLSGEIDSAAATKYLVKFCGMDGIDAWWAIDEWDYVIENGTKEDYSKYGEFYKAVESGENLDAVIAGYTSNGVEGKKLSSQITVHFKPEYIEMSQNERSKLYSRIVDALVKCGVNRKDAEYRVNNWEFEAQYGFAYEDREQAYKNGDVTDVQMMNAIMKMSGKTEEEAAIQVEIWNWEMEIPDCKVTQAAILDYYDHCEAAGIPKNVYYQAWRYKTDTEPDYDEEGNSIAYSVVKKVMPYIGTLNLTDEQKDALALAWWAESTLKKYKTW